MRQSAAFVVILVAVAICSCKKTAPPAEEIPPPTDPQKIFLLVEQEISGNLLGLPLQEPFGLASGKDGLVYVVDRDNNRVIRFTEGMKPDKQIGGYGLGTEFFSRPSFAAIDNSLNLFIADEGNRRVARFDARLNFVDEIDFSDDEDPFKFGYPSGIGITSYGETWIADREKNRVAVFNNVGKFDRFVGEFGSPEGQLLSPEEIVRDKQNRFYVCDAGHSRIVIYDEFGSYLQKLSLDYIDYPISMAIDNDNLWVLDGVNSQVHLIAKSGAWIASFGPNLPGTITSLKQPSDIMLLSSGKLLISDSGNRRLLLCRVERGEAN